ncbi:hypothetical protein CCGE525_00925 [Rhizobium jaguaris]|uniref:Uncharacterized protein n=1 Tax=Rhizobium jaguaris TaxID=1312183 RepID=A0A387FG90_9HYPH|nr:hypothetical protein CCGE525_00925 [Rhizobium jaguaris]
MMKHDTVRKEHLPIDLAEKYRPVALGAVRAAYSVAPAKNSTEARKDASDRLLVPESLPD